MKGSKGFLLIEVILAIGIVGGGVLCLLGLFMPIFSKVKDMEVIGQFEEVEGRINTYIQMRSFDEIYKATQQKETFYFYENHAGELEVCKSLSEIQGGARIIRAKLFPSMMSPLLLCEAKEYGESCFGIWVEIKEEGARGGRNYVVIKNR